MEHTSNSVAERCVILNVTLDIFHSRIMGVQDVLRKRIYLNPIADKPFVSAAEHGCYVGRLSVTYQAKAAVPRIFSQGKELRLELVLLQAQGQSLNGRLKADTLSSVVSSSRDMQFKNSRHISTSWSQCLCARIIAFRRHELTDILITAQSASSCIRMYVSYTLKGVPSPIGRMTF